LAAIQADATTILTARGLKPTAWQAAILRNRCLIRETLLCCSRQSGKSEVASALALATALDPDAAPADVLLLAKAENQARELFRRVLAQFDAVGRPLAVASETTSVLEFTNGSRILVRPGNENSRSFSAKLLVLDEAAAIPDSVYHASLPTTSAVKGSVIALSSAGYQAGWYWRAWSEGIGWHKIRVTADEVPWFTAEELARYRSTMTEAAFQREFYCVFSGLTDSPVFDSADIDRAIAAGRDLKPLCLEV
jgi:hypothetical protein